MKFQNNARSLQEGVIERGLRLAESARWRDYTTAIREGYQEKNNRSISEDIVATTATCLQNTYDYIARMDETTRVVNMGNFIDYGFEVISATVPNLIAHDLVSVQPMNAKFGAIFYLQYLYGNNKGEISKGDVMRSPFTGSNGFTTFSNEEIDGETVGTGDGTATEFSTTLSYTPIKSKTVNIAVGDTVLMFKESAGGVDTLAAADGSEATINLATGAVAVKLATAPAEGAAVMATYSYDMDLTEVGFSQVDLDLQSVSIEAKPRKLRARWLLDAAYELQKTKGIDAESELVIALSSEIKHEIDGEMLNALYRQAGHTGFEWDCKLPDGAAISYTEYKRTILDLLTEMGNKIFQSTKRIGANFIVGGINFCNIIETLPEFAPASLSGGQVNGPHFIGTLAGKYRVYKNPFYNPDVFLLGYKGSSYLDAGYVYAPYMPLYATPTQVLDDFIFRKGLATSYGTLMLNNMLYAKGTIKNFTSNRYASGGIVIAGA